MRYKGQIMTRHFKNSALTKRYKKRLTLYKSLANEAWNKYSRAVDRVDAVNKKLKESMARDYARHDRVAAHVKAQREADMGAKVYTCRNCFYCQGFNGKCHNCGEKVK